MPKIPEKKVKGYIAVGEKSFTKINEGLRGEVDDIPVKFPRLLGAQHPFSFEDVEKVYKRVSIVPSELIIA